MQNLPTVFHITHSKAGSQWVAEILKYCALERTILALPRSQHFWQQPIKVGSVYLTLYLSKQNFDSTIASQLTPEYLLSTTRKKPQNLVWNYWNFQVLKRPQIKFLVIRDLRDTLVSWYFSIMFSHPQTTNLIKQRRKILQSKTKTEGMIYMLDNYLSKIAEIQSSWFDQPDVLVIKYEDLVENELENFRKIIRYCQIPVCDRHIEEVVSYNTFEKVTGRKRGEENINCHQRKGIVGDWRNHFSPELKDRFKEKFGNISIETKYEKDLNW